MAQGNATVSFERITGGLGIGVNNAPVSATFHLPPERGETPPNPSSTVPFIPDPDYVERPVLRDEISSKLSAPRARVALVGLGGAGKTQLAVDCAQYLRKLSPQTWVLWLHAGTTTRFEQSVRDVANVIKIYGRRDPNANIFELFRDWLCDSNKGRWVLILDNVDDATFLLASPASTDKGPTRRLIDYLPPCEHGSMLVTTRSKSEARRIVHINQMVEIPPMEDSYAKALLEKKLGQNEGRAYGKLAAALDYLPLAMAQAAAYIYERTPRCSVEQYIEELEKSSRSRTSLLRREEQFPDRKSDEASSSILVTWQISFEHIVKTRRSAADLLSVMSFCNRQAIPENLLRDHCVGLEHGENTVNADFEDDVTMLRNFSFISATIDRSSWEMHRLVQDATRMWLDDRGETGHFQDCFLIRLDQAFPMGGVEDWPICQTLLPHVQSAMEHGPLRGEALENWASVTSNAAWYALQQGQWVLAESLAKDSLGIRTTLWGENDKRTVESMAVLGEIYRISGRWNEAEELQVKVMEMIQATLGDDNPSMLTSMAFLGATYCGQGRLAEAEELQVKVMERSQATLGDNHLDTLSNMASLALTYHDQGRWTEAEELYVKVMERRQATLGDEHPDTLINLANLAITYQKQGRWTEAEDMQVKVKEGFQAARIGDDHPYMLSTMDQLAFTYQNQGRWTEAEELQVQVVRGYTNRLGDKHPDTTAAIAELEWYRTRTKGAIYQDQSGLGPNDEGTRKSKRW